MENVEYNEYAVSCFRDEADAILNLIPQLDSSFTKAVDLVYHCKGKVIVTGVGKSGHVGAKIAATLASLGTPSFFLNPLDAYHGDLGMVATGDVVIAISYSGNTDELLRFIPLLQKRNIPIIGISGNPHSLLAKCSACHLNVHVEREADPLNLAPTSSTTATMAMGDALACALVKVRHFEKQDFAQFHPGGTLGKRLLMRVCDVMYKENLPSLTPDMPFMDALVIISDGKLGMAVVLDGNLLVGLLTSGDIRRALQKYAGTIQNMKVSEIMTCQPKTIRDDDSIAHAEEVFQSTPVNLLVVVDNNNRFVGFLDYKKCQ